MVTAVFQCTLSQKLSFKLYLHSTELWCFLISALFKTQSRAWCPRRQLISLFQDMCLPTCVVGSGGHSYNVFQQSMCTHHLLISFSNHRYLTPRITQAMVKWEGALWSSVFLELTYSSLNFRVQWNFTLTLKPPLCQKEQLKNTQNSHRDRMTEDGVTLHDLTQKQSTFISQSSSALDIPLQDSI